MPSSLDRRSFLETSAAAGAAWAAGSYFVSEAAAQQPKSANEALTVCVMGVNGRGGGLVKSFMAQPNVQVAYICDVDENAMARAVKAVGEGQEKSPQGVKDFRKALEDKSLDILVCAAPNHWHAPATILGCSAGKHVYVEKPCSHNPREGELAVEAARKNKRVVQMGSQRRSRPGIIKGIAAVHSGAIGRVMYSRTWYTNKRPSIGIGKPATIPTWLDWALWQGPAPEKDFVDNVVHYNWHWKWHWGNGELGNNGVHALDVARWGMQVDYPIRVTSGGGKYRHDDDQETPDTHLVTYDFPGKKSISWEGLSWSPYGSGGSSFGMTFHGDQGTISIDENGYQQFDMQNKEVAKVEEKGGGEGDHLANFLACIKSGERPNADIEHGHKSTLLCHLGNISQRVNRVLTTDEKNGHILGDDQAMALWSREYRKGWEPVV
jgi:predicted dehydrogenase